VTVNYVTNGMTKGDEFFRQTNVLSWGPLYHTTISINLRNKPKLIIQLSNVIVVQ